MAAYPVEDESTPASPGILTSIDTLDASARKLYRRARNAGSSFEATATVVRDLHTVLKHLKVEAEDPDSLLNSDNSTVYTRQLEPIIEDAEFALKQLDTILEKYFDCGSSGSSVTGDGERHVVVNDSEKGWTMLDSLELDKVDLIRTKLASQKLSIDMFLDTVQLHNPSKSRQLMDTTSADLDAIKDKVDAIASRLCQRRDSGFGEGEDQLWEQFRNALEEDGFSKDVLRKNQDVLRAYIRQVDERSTEVGGGAPSVRGFLENYTPPANPDISPPYPAPTDVGVGDSYRPDTNNEKFISSVKIERERYGDYPPQPAQLSTRDTGLSYDQPSCNDQNESPSSSMALISTKELMALDNKNTDLAIAMGNVHMHNMPPSMRRNCVTSSSRPQRYPAPSSSQPLLFSPSDRSYTLDEQYDYEHDPPPRYVPSLPPPPLGGDRSSPPTINSNSVSAPLLIRQDAAISSRESTNQRVARLGPDSQGREILPDAKWTRIRRSLVSPEVLAREGLRYEARPEFVAVLGELKREDIAELARKSAEVRNGRRREILNGSGGPTKDRFDERRRRPEDSYHPDKYRNWDVIESRRDQNGPGYVINPHHRHRANSTASSTGELWDSSDDEVAEDTYGHALFTRHPSSYSPPSRPRPSSDYHSFNSRSGSNRAAAFGDGDDKGTKAYPVTIPSPTEKEKNGESREKTSPSATVKPKPILKNKHDDPHVRFDPEPQVFEDGPGLISQNAGRRDRGKEISERDYRDRDRDKLRTRDRDREKRNRSDRYLDREHRSDRDADRDREHDHRHNGGSSSSKYYTSTSGGRRGDRDDQSNRRYRDDRDRDRDRDRGNRKKARNETLRAVGIGGAAASLLSVLTEAAAGL